MFFEVDGEKMHAVRELIEADTPHEAAKKFRDENPGYKPTNIDQVDLVHGRSGVDEGCGWHIHGQCSKCGKDFLTGDTFRLETDNQTFTCVDCQ